MLHQSRKTKSLRRNQRGAAVRDGDVVQPLRQRWPGQVRLRGGTVPGSGEDGGAGEPWASPAGAGGAGRGARGARTPGRAVREAWRTRSAPPAGSAHRAGSTRHPFRFQLAVSAPLSCPLRSTWAVSPCGHAGQCLYNTEHPGGLIPTGPPRVRQRAVPAELKPGNGRLSTHCSRCNTRSCNIDFLGIGRKSFAVA